MVPLPSQLHKAEIVLQGVAVAVALFNHRKPSAIKQLPDISEVLSFLHSG